MKQLEVSKEEFDRFLANYPRPLYRGVYHAHEPPQAYWSDPTFGDFADNVVACYGFGPGYSDDVTPQNFRIWVEDK